MAFNTSISGLNAASADLNVVGNNIANSGTAGFKSSRTEFSDVYPVGNVGSGSITIGSGVSIGAVAQQFTQGNISFTNNALDLAVSGQGFFRMSDNGAVNYTRAGAFHLDGQGYISNTKGNHLTGYQAVNGVITGALGDMQISTADLTPLATSTMNVGINLNAASGLPLAPTPTSSLTLAGAGVLNTASSPQSTPAFTVYDANGTAIGTAQLQFTWSGAGNVWGVTMIGTGGTSTTTNITTGVTGATSITWDPDGAGAQPAAPVSFNVAGLTTNVGAGALALTATQVGGGAQGAFNPNNPLSYNNATSTTIYDSLGNTHLASMYYVRTAPLSGNSWDAYLYVDGTAVGAANPLTFGPTGALTSGGVIPGLTYVPVNGASPIVISMDYSVSTQFGSPFGVNSLSQNGYTTGRLSGVEVDADGVLIGRYTNGQTLAQGQVVLANFSNVQGLQPLGDTSWGETSTSGAALVGAPKTASLGAVQSGGLEDSNVNLTEQLVKLIVAQRNFQANAQSITAENTITQTIINIR
jgi:flagellar hook protein FlgE